MQHHVVGSGVVFPGVGYVELAFVQLSSSMPRPGNSVARNVAFMRIWVLASSP